MWSRAALVQDVGYDQHLPSEAAAQEDAIEGPPLTQHADDPARPSPGPRADDRTLPSTGPGGPAPHRSWLDRRWIMAAYAAFTAYAAITAVSSEGRDRIWAVCAVGGYGAATILLWRSRGWTVALLVPVAAALVAPLLWLSAAEPPAAGMTVIVRSAALLLRYGSPYLTAPQVSSWLSYNPYLPVMAFFGLPRAAGLSGLAGNPGLWLTLVTAALLAAVFWNAAPHPARQCPACRREVLRCTAFAVASPVIALNLAVTTTDPPVLALMLLALAVAACPSRVGLAGVFLGVACAMKATAWLAVPIIAAMFWSRDGARAAGRFAATSVVAAVAVIAATAPATLVSSAMIQNTVLFPLGLTHQKTPAQSLLPGHFLAAAGPVGHMVSIGLLLAAGLAVAASVVLRPPRDVPAATWRLALGLGLMFVLGPADRFGYFIYSLGLLGWLALTRQAAGLLGWLALTRQALPRHAGGWRHTATRPGAK
jgi:Glycosyltransferase family 87